jgi:hypothetical protein
LILKWKKVRTNLFISHRHFIFVLYIEKGNQPDDQANDAGPALTAVDPAGFFPQLEAQDACSVCVAIRVRPLVARELNSGNKKVCISSPVVPEKNP